MLSPVHPLSSLKVDPPNLLHISPSQPSLCLSVTTEMDKDEIQVKESPIPSKGVESSRRKWLWILFTVIGGGWFFWPRCSHHMLRTPITLQDRVHNILTNTPLIGN